MKRIIEHPRFEQFIIVIIVINAITLGLETNSKVMESSGFLLSLIDRVILAIFTIEVVVKMFIYRGQFFRDPWRIFDFLIVAISLIPTTDNLSILRSLRILRVLRLISTIPSLKKVVNGLIAALPGMGSISMLLSIVFYVFSVMATKLFGVDFPEWFGSIGASAYSLFQIMTLESWSMGIVRPVMEVFSFAWIFFIAFILCTTFTVLNLFIGIIVSAMQEGHEDEASAERDNLNKAQQQILLELKEIKEQLAQKEK